MERLTDWERRLHDFLTAAASAVFGYDHDRNAAHYDCSTFAAAGVIALTGVDPIPEFRGRYTTAAGAKRALIRYGAGDLSATLDAKFPERNVAFTRRGDLVMAQGAVGICVGATAVFVGSDEGDVGLTHLPRAEWQKAWGIG